MTKEIQKAIDFIHAYMHPVGDSESEKRKLKYRDMAIRSLEAWEKVKEDLSHIEKPEPHNIGYLTGLYEGVQLSMMIIERYLSEVEVSNATD